jgi:hypothetical protein
MIWRCILLSRGKEIICSVSGTRTAACVLLAEQPNLHEGLRDWADETISTAEPVGGKMYFKRLHVYEPAGVMAHTVQMTAR